MNTIMIKVEEILEQLISFDAVGDKENYVIIDWIGEFGSSAGFKTKILENRKNEIKRVWHWKF